MDRIALKTTLPSCTELPLIQKARLQNIGTPPLPLGFLISEDCQELEISNFQLLLGSLERTRLSNIENKRIWLMETNGVFSVKSLSKHLSPATPMDLQLEKSLQKSKSPRVSITLSIMLFRSSICASIMQKKLPTHYISPHVCPFYLKFHAELHHLFECVYAAKCRSKLFHTFNLS